MLKGANEKYFQKMKIVLNSESMCCVKKIGGGWVSQKCYVIVRVGHGKCLRPITRWVGGVKKGQKHAYVIFEWSLMADNIFFFMIWTRDKNS